MGVGCPCCEKVNNISKQESGITFKINSKNKRKNIIKRNQLIPTDINNKNKLLASENKSTDNYKKDFPKGTKYEKELNSKFKYFDVLLYDPNKTNALDNYKKSFNYVRICYLFDIEKAKKIIKEESVSKWIVITICSKGEELIQNLKDFECIKAFFILCEKEKFDESWANKIEKVIYVTSNAEILCQKLIEFNENFAFPNLDYQLKGNLSSSKNEKQYEKLFEHYSHFIKILIHSFVKGRLKYSNFCIKAFEYLNKDEYKNDIYKAIEKKFSVTNTNSNRIKILKEITLNNFELDLNLIKNLTLISSEANEYPFLLHLLSFQEVKNIFENKVTENFFDEYIEPNIYLLSCELSYKAFSDDNIINEKTKLKELQTLLLNYFTVFLL